MTRTAESDSKTGVGRQNLDLTFNCHHKTHREKEVKFTWPHLQASRNCQDCTYFPRSIISRLIFLPLRTRSVESHYCCKTKPPEVAFLHHWSSWFLFCTSESGSNQEVSTSNHISRLDNRTALVRPLVGSTSIMEASAPENTTWRDRIGGKKLSPVDSNVARSDESGSGMQKVESGLGNGEVVPASITHKKVNWIQATLSMFSNRRSPAYFIDI